MLVTTSDNMAPDGVSNALVSAWSLTSGSSHATFKHRNVASAPRISPAERAKLSKDFESALMFSSSEKTS